MSDRAERMAQTKYGLGDDKYRLDEAYIDGSGGTLHIRKDGKGMVNITIVEDGRAGQASMSLPIKNLIKMLRK